MTHCSGYFRAAFTGSFKEAEEKRLHLEDVTKETFDDFVDWLYQRDLGRELSDTDEDGDEDFLNMHEITKVHIFADRYDIPDLQRDTIDTMFAYFRGREDIPTAETIKMAFESLPDTSLLRKLLVHRYCESKWDLTPEDESLWTHEFIHDVLARYRCMAQNFLFKPDLCDYHDHTGGGRYECQKKREDEEW